MTRLGDETGAINLSQGLPDFDPPPEVLAAAVAAIHSGNNQYTFPFGAPAFRAAIAAKSSAYNHIPANPETEITVTCGVSEALMATVLALTDPGDVVVLFEPFYENYLPVCHLAGVSPRIAAFHAPDYHLDFGELRQVFAAGARLVILNTPHNPSGRVLGQAELEALAALCQEFNVIAVTDEIYEHILYDGREHISLGSLPGMAERTVTISGLGKTYSLTGWRVGWAVADARLTKLIRKVHDYMTVCAPAPFQAAGIVALGLPESYYREMNREYARRRKLLLEALEKSGFRLRIPEGAYYVMADFSGISWDLDPDRDSGWSQDRAFAQFMAETVGVAVVPGSSFYAHPGGGISSVRFNFAKSEDTLSKAAQRLAKLAAS